jgi:hypothetical protein
MNNLFRGTVEALSSPPTLQDVGAGWGKLQSSALAPSPIIISLPACRVPILPAHLI